MIALIVTVCVLSMLVIILGFSTFNLLRKNEKAEDIVVGYLQYLDKISRIIEISDEKLKKLDQRGTFSSDDEVGFFFKSIQNIQEILNDFKLKKY
jgi:ABC-type Na+ efflux pump permease subunit|tara:strand:- start:45 stop:329 length:285 start_codon:yes stop_codon:yes gene_type:complete